MGVNRVFLPQNALDAWMEKGRIDVEGDEMKLQPGGQRFKLKTALHFKEELTGAGDAAGLVGKVKDLEQVAEIGGEHAYDSVILGDNAYTVVEGFVGEPIVEEEPMATGGNLAAAAAAATGETTDEGEIDLLARFFLSNS
jgi:hypothetical protein